MSKLKRWSVPVSYTHLDVYKRQVILSHINTSVGKTLQRVFNQESSILCNVGIHIYAHPSEHSQCFMAQGPTWVQPSEVSSTIHPSHHFTGHFVEFIARVEALLGPVSYTHLDVYKRQFLLITSATGCSKPEGPGIFTRSRKSRRRSAIPICSHLLTVKCHNSAYGRLPTHKPPWEATDNHSSIKDLFYVPSHILSVDNVTREEERVHYLIILWREKVIKACLLYTSRCV